MKIFIRAIKRQFKKIPDERLIFILAVEPEDTVENVKFKLYNQEGKLCGICKKNNLI